jgi:dethiobiotin synthetase
MAARLPGIFVTGTDTGVGKTYVAAAVARSMATEGRRVGVLKPVATGAARENGSWRCDDAERLIAAVGGGIPVERVAPIVFEEPLAPCVAARRAGEPLLRERVEKDVSRALEWWAGEGRAEVMVVEGVGGLLCPLAEGTTVAELAVRLDFPLLVVARRGLGTLNHTLLTVEAALGRALRVAGVVLNSPEPESGTAAEATNAEELSRRLPPGLAVLSILGHAENLALPEKMVGVDWYGRALPPRIETLGREPPGHT